MIIYNDEHLRLLLLLLLMLFLCGRVSPVLSQAKSPSPLLVPCNTLPLPIPLRPLSRNPTQILHQILPRTSASSHTNPPPFHTFSFSLSSKTLSLHCRFLPLSLSAWNGEIEVLERSHKKLPAGFVNVADGFGKESMSMTAILESGW